MADEPKITWPNGDKTLAETIGDWVKARRVRTELGRTLNSGRNTASFGIGVGDWQRLGEVMSFQFDETHTVLGALAILATEVDRQAGRTNNNLHGKYPFLFD
jgi:hypothetical protein